MEYRVFEGNSAEPMAPKNPVYELGVDEEGEGETTEEDWKWKGKVERIKRKRAIYLLDDCGSSWHSRWILLSNHLSEEHKESEV